MKRYEIHWQRQQAAEHPEGKYCLASDVAELERRIYECESAMLLRHDAAIAAYIEKYPEPVKAPAL